MFRTDAAADSRTYRFWPEFSALEPLPLHNLFCAWIPHRNALVEVCEIGQMTANGGIIPEYLVFHYRLAAPHGIKEIGLVIDEIAVAFGHGKDLALFIHLVGQRCGKRVLLFPFIQVLLAHGFWPPENRISFGLWARVLGRVGERGVFNDKSSLRPVERDELSTFIIQVATNIGAEVRIVVERFDEIREVATILPAEQPARRLGSGRDRVRAGDEMNARDQMHEQVTGQPFSIIAKAAPAEESNGIERPLRRAIQECIPVDRLLTGVRRDGINPGATGRIAVPIGNDVEYLSQFSGIVYFFCLRVENRTHALTPHLYDAAVLLRSCHDGEAILDSVRHRLLAIHVLAGRAGILYYLAVLMIRNGDDDRVNILAVQNLLVVAGGGDNLLYRLLRRLVTRVIQVANCHAFNARHQERRLQQFTAAHAGADGCEAHRVTGCKWHGRRQKGGRLQHRNFRDRARCGGRSTYPDELPAS